MATLRKTDGTLLTQTAFVAGLAETTHPSTWTVGEDVYEDTVLPGALSTEGLRLKWYAGQIITNAEKIDAYLEPTYVGISPAGGAQAGGTPVTLTGTNLFDVTGITFDGVAATVVVSVSATSVTCVSPAHAPGAVNVVITTPAGTATGTGVFTYS